MNASYTVVMKSSLEAPYISSRDAKNILYPMVLKYLPDYLPTVSPIFVLMQPDFASFFFSHFYLLKSIFILG
jgi:hypothetical protein